MSKVIQSPVARWPGSATISDPLTFPQVFIIEDALAAVEQLRADGKATSMARINYALLPAVLGCVEQLDLKGLPERLSPETFPATPRQPSAELAAWLLREVMALFSDANEVPLGS